MLHLPLSPAAAALPRLAQLSLQASLADTLVVVLQGPRQCGKTTLARTVAEPEGFGYLSFDDDNLVRAARADPLGFVTDLPPRMVLDEVQRAPEIFTSLKLVVAGGFSAALMRQATRRRAWYQAYVQTLVQRDVRDLARIATLDVIPRLLELAAGQTAHLFNASELASPFGLSRPTVRDYLTLLERAFLVDILPPWHVRHFNRLVKTPKLHLGDTGLACALLRLDAQALHANRVIFAIAMTMKWTSCWSKGLLWPESRSKLLVRSDPKISGDYENYRKLPGTSSPAGWCCTTARSACLLGRVCLPCRFALCGSVNKIMLAAAHPAAVAAACCWWCIVKRQKSAGSDSWQRQRRPAWLRENHRR